MTITTKKESEASSHNQLRHFCQLAETAEGEAILDLIKQVLEAPNIYVFAEFLALPNIQQFKSGENIKYFNTLNLFAYGTYKQYRQNPDDYLVLNAAMQKKLQHLTIVTLAIETKYIPYDVLLAELSINNVRNLEDVIIEAIYADIIHGKLFQNDRYLEIDYAQGRDIPADYTKKIVQTLHDWIESCESVSSCIDEQIKRANTEKAKRLTNQERIEREISTMKKVLKTQIADSDDVMQIDSRETSSTSQEARRKSNRPKVQRPSGGSFKFSK